MKGMKPSNSYSQIIHGGIFFILFFAVIFPLTQADANPFPVQLLDDNVIIERNGFPYLFNTEMILNCKFHDFQGGENNESTSIDCLFGCKLFDKEKVPSECDLVIIPFTGRKFYIQNFINRDLFSGFTFKIDVGTQSCEITSSQYVDPGIFGDHYCKYNGVNPFVNKGIIILFIFAQIITIISECIAIAFIIKFIFKKVNITIKRIIIVVGITNIITLPIVWFVLPNIFDFIQNIPILFIFLVEIIVFLFEAIIYRKFFNLRLFEAVILSSIANIISYILGELLL